MIHILSCIILYIKRHVLTSETATNNFTIGGDTSAVCLLDAQEIILKLKNSFLFRNKSCMHQSPDNVFERCCYKKNFKKCLFFFFTFELLQNSYIREIVTTAFYILRAFSRDVFLHVKDSISPFNAKIQIGTEKINITLKHARCRKNGFPFNKSKIKCIYFKRFQPNFLLKCINHDLNNKKYLLVSSF